MRIKSAEFSGAIATPDGRPPGDLPQVAFSGRSNVGKSSLINRLLGRTRTQMARVSASPGKTQEINFFRVRAETREGEREFFLVDLPGYGFARVPKEVRERWGPLIEGYLARAETLRGVVQLLDARHPPTKEDRSMVRYLAGLRVPTLFVPTKMDKLGRQERARSLERIQNELSLDTDQVLPFSSVTGEGREQLLESLEHLLEAEDAPEDQSDEPGPSKES